MRLGAVDPNSFADTKKARVRSFDLHLQADFQKSVMSGYVDQEVEVMADGVEHVVFDVKTLDIYSVTLNGEPLQHAIHGDASEEPFGAALVVTIPPAFRHKGTIFTVRIAYATRPSSSAIQWLPPAQTAGKKHPYLFTQCQAIHARSLLPCQDTPGNKCPYRAIVSVPAPLVALMSALSTGQPTPDAAAGTITYSFHQPVPMSSYLVALAVGALEKRAIGPRSDVWSEKEMVDAGAHEFADTEKFIAAAEAICGPYVWTRYDVLLLPPSFPYGGMENPCLTFVTPTLLAGDRSLANVVAHEIAHSWMGNLVSPTTWEHFWLNEGFTVFLERKIVRALHGDKHQHLHAILGYKALEDSVDRYGHDHPFTVLNVKLAGVDPDDAFSSVPYEKGFNLLWYLEQLVGGPAVMDPFLRAHCKRFEFSATTSQEWRDFFVTYMKEHAVPDSVLNQIDWEAWLHKPGMLPVAPRFDTSLVDAAHSLAAALMEGKAQPSADDFKGWSSNQLVIFLQAIVDAQKDAGPAPFAALLQRIDELHHLTQSRNAEVRFKWLTACVRAGLDYVFPAVVSFLTEQGRMKFVRPLYLDLFRSEKGKQLAIDTFQAHRAQYHSIAAKMIAKDLGV